MVVPEAVARDMVGVYRDEAGMRTRKSVHQCSQNHGKEAKVVDGGEAGMRWMEWHAYRDPS